MILIVDDKPENLFSLRSLLQLYSYEVDTAMSGEEALKKLLRNEYAVIILDVQMPGMDGYEVAEAVSGMNKTKDIPIIFLSAVNIDKRFITKGYEFGGVDYVTKPFDNDLLLLKVKTFYRLYEQKRDLKQAEERLRKEVEMRKQSQKEVEQMNLTLEQKVNERTRDLQQANHDLENRNDELAQYAYLASHDLQEPLRKIITFGKIVEERYLGENEDAQKDMSKVITSALRMRNLINDLLNYSKLNTSVYFVKVDLNNIVREVLYDLELVVAEKLARIEIGLLPEIEAAPGQMRQMFLNLLSNALKFSRKTVSPFLEVWSDRTNEKRLDAPTDENGNYARIFFRDNGIGIEEVYQERIFEIFQRLHSRHEYEGTGIGLAVVKKIVEKHDGIIGVASAEGAGTTFTILLPLKQERNGNGNTQTT